jgi:hypothetical protein
VTSGSSLEIYGRLAALINIGPRNKKWSFGTITKLMALSGGCAGSVRQLTWTVLSQDFQLGLFKTLGPPGQQRQCTSIKPGIQAALVLFFFNQKHLAPQQQAKKKRLKGSISLKWTDSNFSWN